MAVMKSKNKTKVQPSEKEIDAIVESQADDDSAWGKPIYVQRAKSGTISLPPDLAARVAFLAKLHRETDIGLWLTRVIKERVELEELAYTEAKRELSLRNGV
jgi:hypothetical protein